MEEELSLLSSRRNWSFNGRDFPSTWVPDHYALFFYALFPPFPGSKMLKTQEAADVSLILTDISTPINIRVFKHVGIRVPLNATPSRLPRLAHVRRVNPFFPAFLPPSPGCWRFLPAMEGERFSILMPPTFGSG